MIMGTRVPAHNYTVSDIDVDDSNHDNGGNHIKDDFRSADSYINEARNDDPRPIDDDDDDDDGDGDGISGVGREDVTEDSLDRDEGSITVDCLDESYKDPIQIPTLAIEDDRSSLESSGSLRNPCNTLTVKDVLPIETARARFLQIILDHFVGEHVVEKRGIENTPEPGEDKLNKRKAGEVQYEGDPRFVLPLMYVANLYETLVNDANIRIASLHGLSEKTIGVALEASGGLYRKLTQKFPKTGSYSFRRRELATSLETRTRFPELVVQEEKRVRFVVANGLDIVEKPNGVPADDAEWFKRLTGRGEVAVTARDFKFYNPRHKVRRASSNTSPTVAIMHSYHGSNGHDFHSAMQSPREHETPSKLPMVTVARQPQFEPVILNHHESLNQNHQTTIICHAHENGPTSHLPDIPHAHPAPALPQNMGSIHPHPESHVIGHVTTMPTSPAKFCDECGSPYVRPTSKFCSQCGTKRYGI